MNKRIICFCFFFLFITSKLAFCKENKLIENQLIDVVKIINKNSNEKNFNKLVNYLPPHLIASMALRLGKTNDELREDFKKRLTTQIKNDPTVHYTLSENTIYYDKTSDGQIFALIPTNIEDSKKTIHKQSLAIYENNNWYVIYGGAQAVQNQLFTLIYPSFGEIHFQPDEIIKK